MGRSAEEHMLRSDQLLLASLRSQKELLDHLIDDIESDKIDDVSIRGALQALTSNYKNLKKDALSEPKMPLLFDFHIFSL